MEGNEDKFSKLLRDIKGNPTLGSEYKDVTDTQFRDMALNNADYRRALHRDLVKHSIIDPSRTYEDFDRRVMEHGVAPRETPKPAPQTATPAPEPSLIDRGIGFVKGLFKKEPEKPVEMPKFQQWENQAEIEQSAKSPVFRAQNAAQMVLDEQKREAGEGVGQNGEPLLTWRQNPKTGKFSVYEYNDFDDQRPLATFDTKEEAANAIRNPTAATNGLIFQTKEAERRRDLTPEQRRQAIEGSTGAQLAKSREHDKQTFGERWGLGGKMDQATVAGAENMLGNVVAGIKNTLIGMSAGLATPSSDPNIQAEREKSVKEADAEMYKKSQELSRELTAKLAQLNIEPDAWEQIKKGDWSRIPEATMYTIMQGVTQIVPALATYGTSTYFQTLPQAYEAGVEAKAKALGITPEEVIATGQDDKEIAQLSAAFQAVLERAGAGLVSQSIKKEGLHKVVKDWVLNKVGRNRAGRILGGAAGVGAATFGEGLTGAGQEMTSVAQEGYSAGQNPIAAIRENRERIVGGGFNEAIGGGGLIAGGKLARAALPGRRPPAQLGGIPTQPAPPGPTKTMGADGSVIYTFTSTEDVPVQYRDRVKQGSTGTLNGKPYNTYRLTLTPDESADFEIQDVEFEDVTSPEIPNKSETAYTPVTPEEYARFEQGDVDPDRLAGIEDDLAAGVTTSEDPLYQKMLEVVEKARQDPDMGIPITTDNQVVEPGLETVPVADEGAAGGAIAQSDAEIEAGQQRSGFQFQSPISQLPQEAQSIIQSASQGKLISLDPVKALMNQLYDQYRIYSKQAGSTSRNLTIPQIQQGKADYEQAMTVLGDYINNREGGEFMREFAAKKKAEPTVVPGGEWIEESVAPDPITKLQALGLSLPEIAALSPEQQQTIISESEGVSTGATPAPATGMAAPAPEDEAQYATKVTEVSEKFPDHPEPELVAAVAVNNDIPVEEAVAVVGESPTLPPNEPQPESPAAAVPQPPDEAVSATEVVGEPATNVAVTDEGVGGKQKEVAEAQKPVVVAPPPASEKGTAETNEKKVTPVKVNGLMAIDENGDVSRELSDKIEQLKKDNDKDGLNEIYSTVKILLNGVAQSKGPKVVEAFKAVKKDLEDYAKSKQSTPIVKEKPAPLTNEETAPEKAPTKEQSPLKDVESTAKALEGKGPKATEAREAKSNPKSKEELIQSQSDYDAKIWAAGVVKDIKDFENEQAAIDFLSEYVTSKKDDKYTRAWYDLRQRDFEKFKQYTDPSVAKDLVEKAVKIGFLTDQNAKRFIKTESTTSDFAELDQALEMKGPKATDARNVLKEKFGKDKYKKMVEITRNFEKIVDKLVDSGKLTKDCP